MRIETLTFVYNEQFLLPFYFKHYDFCDKFNIIYDTDSTDKTLELLQNNPKVNIIPFIFPDGMDDQLKTNKINSFYKTLPEGLRVFCVDADEFIFIDKDILKTFDVNCIVVDLYNVYRHITEKDLDINIPVINQRKHGELLNIYKKPIIVKSGLPLSWSVGNHTISGVNPVDINIQGAHWSNADLSFCIERRVKNRMLRQSKYNLEHGLTIQHHNITDQDVIAECKKHENDPEVFNV